MKYTYERVLCFNLYFNYKSHLFCSCRKNGLPFKRRRHLLWSCFKHYCPGGVFRFGLRGALSSSLVLGLTAPTCAYRGEVWTYCLWGRWRAGRRWRRGVYGPRCLASSPGSTCPGSRGRAAGISPPQKKRDERRKKMAAKKWSGLRYSLLLHSLREKREQIQGLSWKAPMVTSSSSLRGGGVPTKHSITMDWYLALPPLLYQFNHTHYNS